MNRESLLIIDDEPDMLEGIKRILGFDMPDLNVITCIDPFEAVSLFRKVRPEVVLLDVRMPGRDGISLLEDMKRLNTELTCILMTAHGTIELAVEAMRAGAYDFITKPFEKEELFRLLCKGLERSRLISENRVLRNRVGKSDFHGIIGKSLVMQHFFDRIKSIARSDYSVLITGESGTGKELAARAIHAESHRSRKEPVIVNCPAIPEHLLESELFGHRRGAFTGADRDQTGLFEEADGGTLLLDEIGDIPVSIQTKLLRTLQDGEIKPLGSVKSIKVDVRIIAATNQKLEEKIKERSFREDLFYRLNVVNLKTPNLRDIQEDIPLMARYFAEMAARELGVDQRKFSAGAIKLITLYHWPGNVRQLQNVIRQLVIFCRDSLIDENEVRNVLTIDTEKPITQEADYESASERSDNLQFASYREAKEKAVNRFTTDYVIRVLMKTGGNVSKSADLSGIGRASFQKILRRLNIDANLYR